MSSRASAPRNPGAARTPARPASGRPAAGPRHAPKVPFALLVAGLVVGGLAMLLVLNTASAANELRRHDLAEKDAALTARLEELRIQVAASSAPNALASAAAALGMVPAANPAFLQVGADGRVRVLGSPAPASAVFVPPPPPPPTSPKPTPTATAKSTTKKTATPAAKSTATSSPGAARRATTQAKPSPPARPTVTPTPTATLPGGPR